MRWPTVLRALGVAIPLVLVTPALAAPDLGPPMSRGVYVAKGACPFEGCDISVAWRAEHPDRLYAAPGSDAVVAGVRKGERVKVLATEYHAHPRRGVVTATVEPFAKGDVIWTLGPEGEGYTSVWRSGEFLTLPPEAPGMEGDVPVAWDPEPEISDIWWVQVQTPKGKVGWLKDPAGYACMDSLGGDEACGP